MAVGQALNWTDRKLILLALEASGGNQREAVRALQDKGTPYSKGSVSNVATDFHKLRDTLLSVSGVDPEDPLVRSAAVKQLRKRKGLLVGTLAERLHCTVPQTQSVILSLEEAGYLVERTGDRVRITNIATYRPDTYTDKSPLDGNTRRFGVVSDTHLCSKMERLDVLEKAYDYWAKEGITEVYHAGNIVDGQATFNIYEIVAHGATDQALYTVQHYPMRPGIMTHFIIGSCHEGWWMRNSGLDFGRYLMGEMEAAGRTDMNYLGFAEVDVELTSKAGKSAKMRLFHPGGGTAYALSYATQKIVGSLQGGDKPDIMFVGHYHKSIYHMVRNVHCIQAGCVQDQTRFMRNRKLEAHVGYWTVEVEQDSNGAVRRVCPEFTAFYDRSYHVGYTHQG